ncbi:sensor histidine kinase [Microbacterium gilvum]|uniref:histidine kinase n=1 Tax=Microbacterium gilvum TaxID=1336204 RepID=A0ABP9A8S2_9MICO
MARRGAPDARRPRARRRSVAARVLGVQSAVLLVGGALVFAALAWDARAAALADAEDQTTSLVLTLASEPTIVDDVSAAHDDPDRDASVARASAALQPYVERIIAATGVDYITIMDTDRTRYTHADRARIGGEFLGSIAPALDGGTFTEVYAGTLGPSLRAVTPVEADGRIVGLVSAGVTLDNVTGAILVRLQIVGLATLAIVGLGAAATILLFRRLYRMTDGRDPDELARLFAAHEAVLHSLEEGLVLVERPSPDGGGADGAGPDGAGGASADGGSAAVAGGWGADGGGVGGVGTAGAGAAIRRPGRVVLANDQAGVLLASARTPPFDLDELGASARSAIDGPDDVVRVGGRELLVTRSEVVVSGRSAEIVTLRDRTELRRVTGELSSVRTISDALRAQAHEFDNRLHTIASLIELGRSDEALGFAAAERAVGQRLADRVLHAVDEPVIAALLLGKSAQAHERAVEMHFETHLPPGTQGIPPADVVTILGNLVDNAIDAAASRARRTGETGAWIEVYLGEAEDGGIVFQVTDSGDGVVPRDRERVFARGYSTKREDGQGHGYGLALVRQTVEGLGGAVEITRTREGGAVFTVTLPRPSVLPSIRPSAPPSARPSAQVAVSVLGASVEGGKRDPDEVGSDEAEVGSSLAQVAVSVLGAPVEDGKSDPGEVEVGSSLAQVAVPVLGAPVEDGNCDSGEVGTGTGGSGEVGTGTGGSGELESDSEEPDADEPDGDAAGEARPGDARAGAEEDGR